MSIYLRAFVNFEGKKTKISDLLEQYKDKMHPSLTAKTVNSRIKEIPSKEVVTEKMFLEILARPKQHVANNVEPVPTWQRDFEPYKQQIDLVKTWRPTNVV